MLAEKIVELPKSNRMTAEDFDRERADLDARLPRDSKRLAALRDQEWAKLFYRSGWTQEELAKAEGKSRPYIDKLLRFGRFLDFDPIGSNPENPRKTLTEGRFRSYWERTDKKESNERIRFQAVIRLMAEDEEMRRERGLLEKEERTNLKAARQLGEDIRNAFCDGKFHRLTTIANQIKAPEHDVQAFLDSALTGKGATRTEKKKHGKSFAYRIFKNSRRTGQRFISPNELKLKLDPIINGLIAEGKKNSATVSTVAVADLARQLQKTIADWIE
jgi:transcriptional regulator with XRE-family HTH domain